MFRWGLVMVVVALGGGGRWEKLKPREDSSSLAKSRSWGGGYQVVVDGKGEDFRAE